MNFLIYSIISALSFALTFFFRKQALKSLPIYFAFAIELVFGFLIILLFLINSHLNNKELLSNKNGILFAIGAGVFLTVGVIFNYLALKNGGLSRVISITSPAQIIFGISIGFIILGEKLSLIQLSGIALSIFGIILVMR